MFEKYESIYCENFLRLGIQFQRSGGKIIYYPSSQAIGSRFASLRQYSSAKILGEIACDTLQEGWGGVIIKDRLGITKTWQTAGHVDKDASEPIEAAKAILRKVFLCRWIFEECQFK